GAAVPVFVGGAVGCVAAETGGFTEVVPVAGGCFPVVVAGGGALAVAVGSADTAIVGSLVVAVVVIATAGAVTLMPAFAGVGSLLAVGFGWRVATNTTAAIATASPAPTAPTRTIGLDFFRVPDCVDHEPAVAAPA